MTRLALTLALAAGTLCILGVAETKSSGSMARRPLDTVCIRIYSPERLDSHIDEHDIDEVFEIKIGSTACEREERCKQPCITGPCKALFRKWYYDINDGTCKRFVFGGCGGNENKFETRAQCQRACGGYKVR